MGQKRILVSRSSVEQNHSTGSSEPVFTVIDQDGTEYKASDILILGPSEVKYDPEGDEGRRVWIETFANLRINGMVI